jgi:hypothetical protein
MTVTPPDQEGESSHFSWSTIWRHSIHSRKAETEKWLRDHNTTWLREDARLDVVKVRFQIESI